MRRLELFLFLIVTLAEAVAGQPVAGSQAVARAWRWC